MNFLVSVFLSEMASLGLVDLVKACKTYIYMPQASAASRAAFPAWKSAMTAFCAAGTEGVRVQALIMSLAACTDVAILLIEAPANIEAVFDVVRAFVFSGTSDAFFSVIFCRFVCSLSVWMV